MATCDLINGVDEGARKWTTVQMSHVSGYVLLELELTPSSGAQVLVAVIWSQVNLANRTQVKPDRYGILGQMSLIVAAA